MSNDFIWIKAIRDYQSKKINIDKLINSLKTYPIKGFEIEILGRYLIDIKNNSKLKDLKVAILSTYASQPICNAIKVACLCEDFCPIIYEAPFDAIHQEIFNTKSDLYKFNPDLIIIDIGINKLKNLPKEVLTKNQIRIKLESEINEFKSIWREISQNFNIPIIQHTLVSPPLVYSGLVEKNLIWSPISFIDSLNYELIKISPSYVNWLDLDRLAKLIGLNNWIDKRLYHQAKYGFSINYLPQYTDWLRASIRDVFSLRFKAIITDADNTLWGGIIGDDGFENIKLGPETPEGSAYWEFCSYLLSLKQRGIILGICSKNDIRNVKEVFENHPHMPLKLDDFASIKVNWDSKDINIMEISKELNIDTSSIVFIDDNPAECELIRQKIPKVRTLNISNDPSENIYLIDSINLFSTSSITKEDLNRQNSYKAKIKSKNDMKKFNKFDDYLISLQMKINFELANKEHLMRIAQMQSKTNQFNLATRRLIYEDLEKLLELENTYLYVYDLTDKYTNHGLIGYLECNLINKKLVVKDWLMSCRVFSRNLEHYVINILTDKALKLGADILILDYEETSKNSLMKEIFLKLGFDFVYNDNEKIWGLNLDKKQSLDTFFIETNLKY